MLNNPSVRYPVVSARCLNPPTTSVQPWAVSSPPQLLRALVVTVFLPWTATKDKQTVIINAAEANHPPGRGRCA